jgi:hypothetical protein
VSVSSALARVARAEQRLAETTIPRPLWNQRVADGYYNDVAKTSWWQALNELKLAKVELQPIAAGGVTYLYGDEGG